MLIELNKKFAESLSNELERLSKSDKEYFHPHEFDVESIRNLGKEEGNHYYIYLDELGEFAGYGMLRTFGRYEIPTLGCVIWERYRARGNGQRLVEELIEKAQEIKYRRIRLKVASDNKIAYRLYRKTGFIEIGKSENGRIWMEYSEGKGRVKC
jgi:ribosomal protein S18 acetylase RimI-like enzyme